MYEGFFNIEEELKKLPARPGVYIMHDKTDDIIYVGKAISLKNRVRQYFQSSRNLSSKIRMMVSNISRFEYIITDSELEALVLECNLIKLHKPRYNTMLKDDKTYPFIKITTNEEFPRILSCRELKKDKCRYFGPFTSGKAVNDTIELLNKTYGIRNCRRQLPKDTGKERPCLNYHIGQCTAPCQGYITPEEYRELINKAIEFLEGRYNGITQKLTELMKEASGRLDFEQAATYRDMLESVKYISQKQKITSSDMQDKDVVAAAMDETDCVVQVFFMRQGRIIGREHYHMELAEDENRSDVVNDFIKQYYAGTPYIPPTIMLQESIRDEELISRWLSEKTGHAVHFVIPRRGDKEKLVELAEKNALTVLTQDKDKIKREEARTTGAVLQIQQIMGIDDIHRMEAYDISNISGVQSVGSMVVFYDGLPRRNDYRKFRIKTVVGPDDYASMREVLTRRLKHVNTNEESWDGFEALPDLILMDGGKGQVHIALKVIEELGLNIPVCGMVKDDNHRTRALWYNEKELEIDSHSEAFKLITRIQDEAHRFAISFHRNIRSKEQVHSVLDDIDGIGPARRKGLMRHFKDIEGIRKASVEELCNAPSMNRISAERVYDFFHKPQNNPKGDN
ncbi:MAG: excinuclease ABC subunit UvrC [Butyrivibrio sp.]